VSEAEEAGPSVRREMKVVARSGRVLCDKNGDFDFFPERTHCTRDDPVRDVGGA
jgi:hypothetical protein